MPSDPQYKTVFVVFADRGDYYADNEIQFIFSTREKAEACVEDGKKRKLKWAKHGEIEIVEWSVDE